MDTNDPAVAKAANALAFQKKQLMDKQQVVKNAQQNESLATAKQRRADRALQNVQGMTASQKITLANVGCDDFDLRMETATRLGYAASAGAQPSKVLLSRGVGCDSGGRGRSLAQVDVTMLVVDVADTEMSRIKRMNRVSLLSNIVKASGV